MKNPFEKKQSGALVAGVILSSLAAGTISYLFMTKNGTEVREQLKIKVKALINLLTGNPVGKHQPHIHQETAYKNRHKPKAKKSDKEKILKGEILGHHDQPADVEK